MTIKSHESDVVIYTLQHDQIKQDYRSAYFDNVQTTIVIPVMLAKALSETIYQLEWCLDKAELAQHILDQTFHSYFDLKTARVENTTLTPYKQKD